MITKMDSQKLEQELTEIKAKIWTLAQEYKQDNLSILQLLRTLENTHREIRDQVFESSLPNTRNTLYNLIRDMEETGGWPYIERMKLKDLLLKLQFKQTESDTLENELDYKSD
ncbi:MAG: hypothetical protein EA365_03005 [Gloeocapsa sp. DLM2.Bin57]|nr:MAG: hypothetical protein EA365_03005 [Gloeocapsa sp. DLM2.Bin57]